MSDKNAYSVSVDFPERQPLTSLNMTDQFVIQLRDAVPQIFSEGRVDFAKLQAMLGEHIETSPERYGLTWAGKRDAFRNVQVPSVATLRPQPDESVNWDETENLIIEGDNLEVLKLMQKPYHGKVKMIYIDPPYNTGNEFIYPDNFHEGLDEYLRYTKQLSEEGTATSTNKDTSGRYHSNWLSMMYPRLFLARNLLREDGVIFVSIDDHEVHNLRLLMDEVFGEENFVAALVWDRNRKNDAKYFSVGHEYMLVYFRNEVALSEKNAIFRGEKEGVEEVQVLFEKLRKEHASDWDSVRKDLLEFYAKIPPNDPRLPITRFKKVDEKGPYRDDGNINWPGGNGPKYEVLHPKTLKPCKLPTSGWRYPRPERFWEEVQKNRIVFGPDETTVPRVRTNLFENHDQVMGSVHFSYAQTSANKFNALFDGERVFDNPKPTDDIKRLIAYVTESDDLVLDFFAGSGTTAHAVLDLNQQDGGNRKFILVQLPEKTENPQYPTIAHITRERVQRVITNLKNDKEGQLDLEHGSKQDFGFRAFKLDSSNFKIWRSELVPQSAEQMAEQLSLYADNIQPERSDQDRLYELILKSGRPLSARVEPVVIGMHTTFVIEENALLICLEPHLDLETLRALFARKPQMVLCLDTAFDGNDALKTNAVLEAKSHGVTFRTV